jgi:hypothetical protein
MDPFDQGNAASELADADKYANLTKEDLVAAGLMEAEWYRDFAPVSDCFPEDLEEEDFPKFLRNSW